MPFVNNIQIVKWTRVLPILENSSNTFLTFLFYFCAKKASSLLCSLSLIKEMVLLQYFSYKIHNVKCVGALGTPSSFFLLLCRLALYLFCANLIVRKVAVKTLHSSFFFLLQQVSFDCDRRRQEPREKGFENSNAVQKFNCRAAVVKATVVWIHSIWNILWDWFSNTVFFVILPPKKESLKPSWYWAF